MTTTQLTPAQHADPGRRLQHNGGKIDWFPTTSKAARARRCSTDFLTAP